MLPISYYFDLTKDDFIHYLKYHYTKGLGRTQFRSIVGILVFLMFPNVIDIFVLHQVNEQLLLITLFLTGLFSYILFFQGYLQAIKSGIFGNNIITISESGITNKAPMTSVTFSWPLILKITESPNGYFLYRSNTSALVIPKRAFSSAEEHQQWREQVVQFSKKEIQ